MRTGIYLRISDDANGTSTATARQLEDCRKLAEARGWTIADTFEDSDLSAFNRRVVRPEFERMVKAVHDRDIDVVLCWKLDRLARRLRDFARLDEECEAAGARVVTLVDGIDTSTSAGRVVASVMCAMARSESENISVRGARKAREMAQQGRPATGGTRPFGYTRDRMTINEPEAAIIRECAARVLAGETIRGICRDLEARGVTSPGGKAWQPAPLRRMLVSGLLSAQREHGGTVTPGQWPAILTPAETEQLRAVLSDPERRRSFTNTRSYLLSGFLRCGHCHEPLVARPRLDHVRRYVCASRPGSAACGKLARMAEPIEETVFEAICVRLDGATLPELEPDHDGAGALAMEIRSDEAALEELSRDYYADKAISRPEFFAARDTVQARLTAKRAALRKRTGRHALTGIDGAEALRRRWPGESLDWQRAVIGALVDHVVIEPARKGDNRFNPALVRVVWRA